MVGIDLPQRLQHRKMSLFGVSRINKGCIDVLIHLCGIFLSVAVRRSQMLFAESIWKELSELFALSNHKEVRLRKRSNVVALNKKGCSGAAIHPNEIFRESRTMFLAE